jgi:uncharacterized protein YjbI with pentapeptide repeats
MWRFSDLSGRDLTGLDLSGLDLSQADLRNADLSRCVLAGTQLPTELSSCVWAGADLTDCDLRTCNLYGGHLANAKLSNCLLPVDLRRCDLSGCDLSLRDLSRHHLDGAKITTSLLVPTSLTFAGGGVVINTCFRGADLTCRSALRQLKGGDLDFHDLSGARVKLPHTFSLKGGVIEGAIFDDIAFFFLHWYVLRRVFQHPCSLSTSAHPMDDQHEKRQL